MNFYDQVVQNRTPEQQAAAEVLRLDIAARLVRERRSLGVARPAVAAPCHTEAVRTGRVDRDRQRQHPAISM